MAGFLDIWDDLQDDAKTIPAARRLFHKRKKEGLFDISSSKLFLHKPAYAPRPVAALR